MSERYPKFGAMTEITKTQNVRTELSGGLRTLNVDPGRSGLPSVQINTREYEDLASRTHKFEVFPLTGFEDLVNAIKPHIGTVTKEEDGTLSVTLTEEPEWDTGIVSGYKEDKAGAILIARAATYMAAKLKLEGDVLDEKTTIQMRELDANAAKFLTKHPWFNDENAKLRLRPISVLQALRVDPKYLIAELKTAKNKYKLLPTLGTLTATAAACNLAETPPAITAEVPTQTAAPEITITPTAEIPLANYMPLEDINMLIENNADLFAGIKAENITAYDFGAEKIVLFEKDGTLIGRLIDQNKNLIPIYGSRDDSGVGIISWLRPVTDITPVAPDIGVIGSESVLWIETDKQIGHYISPEGADTTFRVEQTAGKVDFAAPVINFEVPTPPTPTPEPTVQIEEIDLKPNYEQNVLIEFMGVKINASLITDKSLDPVIREVTVGENAYAEFIARSIYKVWLKKGGVNGTGPETETSFEQFMTMWATAQKSGLTEDWEKVQVKNIWANEISTPGYEQDPYTFWFMHEGETPDGIRGISKMSNVFIKKSINTTVVNPENFLAYGTNLNFSTLYIYCIPYDHGNFIANPELNTARLLIITWSWLARNSGQSTDTGSLDKSLEKLLLDGGLSLE